MSQLSRVLETPRRTIHKAACLHAKVEDQGFWEEQRRAGYGNALPGAARDLIFNWWHSDKASRFDNDNKYTVRSYSPADNDGDPGKKLNHRPHWRRVQLKSNEEALADFHAEHGEKLKELTKCDERPEGIKVGVDTLCKYKCNCIHGAPRRGSQCACPICTAWRLNLEIYHRARAGWRQKAGAPCDKCDGQCLAGTPCALSSRNISLREKYSLCAKRRMEALDLAGCAAAFPGWCTL